MLDGLTLVPALALVAGALICLRLPGWPQRRRTTAVLGAVALAMTTAVVMAAQLWRSTPRTLSLALSPWSGAVFQSDPALAVDALAALCLVLACLGCLVVALRALAPRGGIELAGGPLLVGAASVLFIAAARSPLGLISAWLLLDVAMFFGARIRRRALLASHLGLLVVLAALMDLPATGGIIDPAVLSQWSRFLLIAAATIRMGLYPFWWPIPRSRPGTLWQACALRVGPTIAGAYLALAVAHAPDHAASVGPILVLPGLVAVVFGALLTWLASDMPNLMDWSTTYYAGLIVLAAGLGTAAGEAAALLLLVDLAIGRFAHYASHGLAAGPATRAAALLAVFSLAGLPPSLGFFGRWLLYGELVADGRIGLLIVLVATTGPVIARWHDLHPRGGVPSVAGERLAAGLAGLASVSWLLGLGFRAMQPMLTDMTGAAAMTGFADQAWVVGGAILLPIVLGPLLRAMSGAAAGAPVESQRQEAMLQVLRLTDLFDGFRTGLIRAGRVIHDGLGFTEGQRAMAWTLLAAIATGASVLEAPPTASTGSVPTMQSGLVLGTAVAVAATMLLVPTPLATLAALAAGYGLAAFVLLWTGAGAGASIASIATIKLVAGGVVVAILAISVVQAPADQQWAGAARRLRRLPSDQAYQHARLLPALVLATAIAVAAGIPAVALSEALQPALLHTALILMAGGILTVVFARTPLRLAGGVLLALTGFELVYAQLEPGLFITGSLAVFQLAFAVVAAAFVGLDAHSGLPG